MDIDKSDIQWLITTLIELWIGYQTIKVEKPKGPHQKRKRRRKPKR